MRCSNELGLQDDPLFKLAMALEKIALEDEYFVSRKLYPNVDYYSGIVQKAIGIPVPLFTAVFALARTVGWIAQLNEMIADPEYKIGRPRQLFVGATRRDVKPIATRNGAGYLGFFRLHRLGFGCDRFVADTLVLGDHLRAQQQENRSDLDAQQHGDRRRQRAVDDLYLRYRRVVPDQDVPRDLPQNRRRRAADQRVTPRQIARPASPDRSRSTARFRRRRRSGTTSFAENSSSGRDSPRMTTACVPRRPSAPETTVMIIKPTAERQDEQVRHDGGHQKVTPPDRDAMKENDRHRILKHGERKRAEKQHQCKQQPADELTMRQEVAQLADQRARLPGNDELQIGADRCQYLRLVENAA